VAPIIGDIGVIGAGDLHLTLTPMLPMIGYPLADGLFDAGPDSSAVHLPVSIQHATVQWTSVADIYPACWWSLRWLLSLLALMSSAPGRLNTHAVW